MWQGKSHSHVSKSALSSQQKIDFADVTVTFPCHISKIVSRGGKTKLSTLQRAFSKKKIAGVKQNTPTLQGIKDHLPKI
jgi:hypothetical protein